MRVRLYVGLEWDEKWFNYAEVGELIGGTLKSLDTINKSNVQVYANMTRQCVKTLHTEDGESIPMDQNKYDLLPFVDTIRIAMEVMRAVTEEQYPKIKEHFFCNVCDRGLRTPTEINESWHQLIEDGLMDEHFTQSLSDTTWEVDLPIGLEIPKGKSDLIGGTFNNLTCKHVSTREELDIIADRKYDTEAKQMLAGFDKEIISIEGMDSRSFNIHLKRNLKESFASRFLIHKKDQDAMWDAKPMVGIDARERSVKCLYCGTQFDSPLDTTNFFLFLSPKLSSRQNGRA